MPTAAAAPITSKVTKADGALYEVIEAVRASLAKTNKDGKKVKPRADTFIKVLLTNLFLEADEATLTALAKATKLKDEDKKTLLTDGLGSIAQARKTAGAKGAKALKDASDEALLAELAKRGLA